MNINILVQNASETVIDADKPFYARKRFSTQCCPFEDVKRAEDALDSLGFAIRDLRLSELRNLVGIGDPNNVHNRLRWMAINKVLETIKVQLMTGRKVEIRGKHVWSKDALEWFRP